LIYTPTIGSADPGFWGTRKNPALAGGVSPNSEAGS
jgi:hypothetical protein